MRLSDHTTNEYNAFIEFLIHINNDNVVWSEWWDECKRTSKKKSPISIHITSTHAQEKLRLGRIQSNRDDAKSDVGCHELVFRRILLRAACRSRQRAR